MRKTAFFGSRRDVFDSGKVRSVQKSELIVGRQVFLFIREKACLV